MRISDWSSDVCSSDLYGVSHENAHPTETFARGTAAIRDVLTRQRLADEQKIIAAARHFGELAREYGIGSEFRIVWRDDLRDEGMLRALRSEEHTSELQSLMRISYAVFCLKKKSKQKATR